MMRKMFIDIVDGVGPGPRKRDIVAAMGKRGYGAIYVVGRSRQVKRRDPAAVPRYQLVVKRIGSGVEDLSTILDEAPYSARCFRFTWYPRKKKRLTFEQHMRRKIPR